MKKQNIFYGVIGVLTLIVSIIGATFAYFTATADNTNAIRGNMATIDFDVTVTKVTDVDVTRQGLIPMSNNMMEQALTKNAAADGKGVCVDDNNNAVCQVYKITVINTSSASMFVDGYVTLTNGSGNPTDYPDAYHNITTDDDGNITSRELNSSLILNSTTMRWAQAFCTETDGKATSCTTAGNSTVRSTNTIALTSLLTYEDTDGSTKNYTTLGGDATKASGENYGEMATTRTAITNQASDAGAAVIQGNKYEVISKNYIRLSNHASNDTTYSRADDTTSALVYNQYLEADDNDDTNNTGTSSSATYKDAQVFYIVVWLSETGTNQTANSTGAGAATSASGFFKGSTTFISAQGSEVTATFNGLTKVPSNT